MSDYLLHKSKLIIDNQQKFIDELSHAHEIHQRIFQNQSSTWTYAQYNLFALTAPSPLFYDLFLELKTVINSYIDVSPKWMQCWMNYHNQNEVLDWHNHEWPFHGYISIDPKQTRTVFREYEIVNEVGNIYIGPGGREHKVVVDSEYSSPRLTLGFDVQTEGSLPDSMLSLIPI